MYLVLSQKIRITCKHKLPNLSDIFLPRDIYIQVQFHMIYHTLKGSKFIIEIGGSRVKVDDPRNQNSKVQMGFSTIFGPVTSPVHDRPLSFR